MDDPNRQRRPNDSLGHHGAGSRFTSQTSRSVPSGSADRYRPTPINTSPQTPRTLGSAGSYSNSYYQEPTSAFNSSNMTGYASDYSHDGRQHSQSFGGYNTAAMMYNVAQPTAQTPVYDAQQFGSRQPAALQMMTPDVTSTYFGAADNASAAAHSLQSAAAAGAGASGSSSVYQQNPSMSYASNMSGVTPSAQQPPQPSADVSMSEGQDYSDGALAEKWHNFQRQLSTVFQDISNGSLEAACDTLLTISSWLLSQVQDLGLTQDDASLHAERIKLWNDFNHAWLALGQKQVDLMSSRQQQSRSQRLLSQETIEKLGNELVRLCDGLERHGLIDYQYGVWEEQIVAVLEDCLDLCEADSRP